MKKNECLNILKDEANKVKIKNNTEYILNNYESYDKNDIIIEKKKSHKINLLFYFLPLAITGVIIMVLLITLNNNTNNPNNITIGNEDKVFAGELLALGKATDINTNLANDEYTKEEYNVASNDLNEYLLTGEAFINNSNINITKELNDNSKYKDYKYVMNVIYKDVKSYDFSYKAYYNEENDGDDILLNGIFINQNLEYRLNGKIEYEKDDFELQLLLYYSDDTYIEIKNENENKKNKIEFEYQFKYVKNDIEIKKTKISYEEKSNNKKELQIEIEENGNKIECEFEYNNDTIEAKYNSDLIECEAIIYNYDTYYLYYYKKDNISIRISKN